MKRALEIMIGKLKGRSDYKLDSTFSNRQLFMIAWYRCWQAVRGLWLKLFIRSNGLVFCGHQVRVEHGYQLKAGRSLILENGVQIMALSKEGIELGENVTIGRNAILSATGVIANVGKGIKVGHRSAVGAGSFLGGQGGIQIGNDVIIGPHVRIFSENHNFDLLEVPIKDQGESRKGVAIGNNCWIGAGSTILDGVVIGDGCVIAAGSVVTASCGPNQILMGVPARAIRHRHEAHPPRESQS